MNTKKLDSAFTIGSISAFIIQTPISIATAYLFIFAFTLANAKHITIKKQHLSIATIIFIGITPAALTFNHGLTPIVYLISTAFSLLAALVLSKRPIDTSISTIRLTYWVLALFIIIGYILNINEPEPLGAILPWASTNGLPSYIIVIQILYSILFFLKNNRLPLPSTITTLVISIMGIGRGSIIVSLLLFTLSIVINIKNSPLSFKRKVLFCLAIAITVPPIAMTTITEANDAIEKTSQYSKFSGGILDEHRGLIIHDYLKKLDATNFFLGMDYEGTSITKYYGGNPHNSFIRVHSFYGIAGLLCILIPAVVVAINRRKNNQRTTTLILISIALIRASTEPIFFPTPLDLFYFLYAAYYVRYSKKKEGNSDKTNY